MATTMTVEDQRERLELLREDRIPELEARAEELEEEIADALTNGGDAERLKERRREVLENLESYRAAVPLVEERVKDAELRRLEDEARERLRTIKKRCGGLAGEQARKVERAAEHLQKARGQLDAAGEAHATGEALRVEAEKLAAAFDLEAPELRRVPQPSSFDAFREWKRWRPDRVLRTGRKQAQGARGKKREAPLEAVEHLEKIDVPLDSPSRELLERRRELEDSE